MGRDENEHVEPNQYERYISNNEQLHSCQILDGKRLFLLRKFFYSHFIKKKKVFPFPFQWCISIKDKQTKNATFQISNLYKCIMASEC